MASRRDIVATLSSADPLDRAGRTEVYAEMGISLTHYRDGRIIVEGRPHGVKDRVGEGI